jgi:hypothetical protein
MSNDWLPSNRRRTLAMCRNWIAYMTEGGRAAWGEGGSGQFAELGTLFGGADALLRKVADDAERTHVITVECHAAFAALKEKMRFFRYRYFKIPPQTKGDWVALGFRHRDARPTPIPGARRHAVRVPELSGQAARADGASGAAGRDAGV